jgi:hypothetical protein
MKVVDKEKLFLPILGALSKHGQKFGLTFGYVGGSQKFGLRVQLNIFGQKGP